MSLRLTSGLNAQRAQIALPDIGGGLNLKSSHYAVGLNTPNQATELTNFILVEDGSLLGRRGTQQWNAISLGSSPVLGATRAYVGSSPHFLVKSGDTVYRGDDVTKTFAASLTGQSVGALAWFWQYLTFVYYANAAGDPPKKWDGTAWTDMGIAAPSSAPTAAVGAAGALNGTYTFKVTFVTATIESNESPVSGTVSPVNQQVNLTSIPTGPAGTIARRIYGFKNAVSSTYQLVGVINDNTTTTFTVTTDQGSWTTAIPMTNNPPVPAAWITVQFKNRLWKAGDAANPTRLYFSQIFVPEAWPTLFFVDIPFDLGDVITGLFVLGDLLLVFGNNSLFYVIGDTPFSFVIKRSFAPSGCPGPWAIDRVENTIVYLSRFAVYAFDGSQSRSLSDPIEPIFTGVLPAVVGVLNYAKANTATLRYYDRLKAVVLSIPTGSSTTNSLTLWYFLRRQGWVKDTRTAAMFLTLSGKGDTGDLYACDATAGILRQWDVPNVFTDDRVSILATYRTGSLGGHDPLAAKRWGYVTVRARPSNAAVVVTVSGDHGAVTDAFVIPLQRGFAYGTGTYGTATYAAELGDFEERMAPNVMAREVMVTLTLTYADLNQLAQLYVDYETMDTPNTRRRMLT